MRATGILLAVTAILLVPSVASADPVQPSAAQMSPAPAAPAQPAVPAQAAAPAVAASAVNLDEVVCKQGAPPTGSRLGGGRECHTLRQWNEQEQTSRDTLQTAQQRGLTAAQPGR